MKEKNIACAVMVLVVLAGLAGALDARVIGASSPSSAADSRHHSSSSALTRACRMRLRKGNRSTNFSTMNNRVGEM